MADAFNGVAPDTLVSFKSGGVYFAGRLKSAKDGVIVLSELVFAAEGVTNAVVGMPAFVEAPTPPPADDLSRDSEG